MPRADFLLAAVYHGRRDIRVQEWPAPPSPQPGWETVAISYCGVCGTSQELIGNIDAQRRFLGVEPLAARQST